MADCKVTCLCGETQHQVRVVSDLPVQSVICHCNSCRHNLGALYHSSLPIEVRPAVSHLRAYQVSPTLTRYFCTTCGSHIYECRREQTTENWAVQSGIIEGIHNEQVFDELEQIAAHQFVEDTQDGGLVFCLTGSLENAPRSFLQAVGSGPIDLQALWQVSDSCAADDPDQSSLHGACHCEGVQFVITRPTSVSRKVSSAWPDLIVPYNRGDPANPEDVKWWIRGKRWLAGTCACRSCRLGLGSPIQAWAFVSRANIFNMDGSPISYQSGTFRAFESCTGVLREFCSTCGATVFWHNDERPGVVDVSVGVLRGKGARAMNWLEWWTKRVSFAEEAHQQQLVRELEAHLPHFDKYSEHL